MPNAPVPATAGGMPKDQLAEIHDCLFLALDIVNNDCPFPQEAVALVEEALERVKSALAKNAGGEDA